MVGAEGFEPTTSSSQSWRSTRLSYTPRPGLPLRANAAKGRIVWLERLPLSTDRPLREPAFMLRTFIDHGTGDDMIGRSGNPALRESTFLDLSSGAVVQREGDAMTLNGTVNKTGTLLLLCVITAAFAWSQVQFTETGSVGAMPYFLGGTIGGLVFALATIFKKEWAPVTAPMYALTKGFALGAISALFEHRFPGIVAQAVMLTFGTLFALLAAYRSGLIKATENFKLGVVAATGGICLVYLATIVMSLFGVRVPFIHESGLIGIGFSLFVVVIAALNLVLDFDFIESGVEQKAPKYMEWYGAFGLMVTLVWLYVEFLRLLSKLQSRN